MSGVIVETKEIDPNRPVIIFVLGLISIVACQVCGPVAFILGHQYRRACMEQGVEPDGLATAGWVMGIIGSIFFVMALIALILYFGAFCVMFVVYFIALFGVMLAA